MAKEHKFFKPVNFFGNYIKRAKLWIADRTLLEDDDLIDKKYVDDQQTFSTEISLDPNSRIYKIGRILDKNTIVGKKISEIFDALFFPLIPNDYIKPESDVDIIVENTLGLQNVTGQLLEVGQSIHFDVTNIFLPNDSIGLLDVDPYEYNIETVSGVQMNQSSLSSYQSADIAIGIETTLFAVSKYKEAKILTDSRGNNDLVGTVENPKFNAGQIEKSSTVYAVWPKFVSVFSGVQALPTNLTLMSVLESAEFLSRILEQDDTTLEFSDQINATTQTIMFAVRKDTASGFAIEVIRGQEDVSSLFTEYEYVNVPDASGNGFLTSYRLFRAELPMTLSQPYQLSINTRKIN